MKAIIEVDVPDYQIGQEVSIYFKDAMMIKGIVQEPETGYWIPVSERLPEESGRYLAYIVNEHDNKFQYIMTCEYMVDGHWNWLPDDECVSDNVIAWMPLPQTL